MRTMPYGKSCTRPDSLNQDIKLDGTPLQPGSTAAVKKDNGWWLVTVYRVEGDQVLVAGHMGHMEVYKPTDLTQPR
ncbi:MAG: hypothetical protein R2939_08430 [Kofleriaceae bacterium]